MADQAGTYTVRGRKWRLEKVQSYMWGQCRAQSTIRDGVLTITVNSTTEFSYFQDACYIAGVIYKFKE